MLEQRWTRGIEGPILVYLRAEGSRSRTARYTASQLLPPRGISKSSFFKFLQNFGGLVLGCIETNFCE